ncbi:hypothetical protein [Kitasatospora cinereorecta]|uniref:Uncharacterized protein n=1 Tax=Kitasatospora cinereorecta TaxID=285560 RepID=A0ABW0V9P8_9ACTN
MIFRRKQKAAALAAAVSELEQAVAARDGARTEQAFSMALHALQSAAADSACVDAGPRLAALLPSFPPAGPRPMLATAAGFCVERGADPTACAEPILDSVRQDLLDAAEFARRWKADGGGELPEPDEKIIDDALLARLGDDAPEALRLALAWCTVEEWQPPALAVLCRSAEVRRRHAPALLAACRELEALAMHDLKCLAYALAVLDDEPLLVLHRPTRTGFEVRISGIGTTSSSTRCSPTSSSATATSPVPHRLPRASAWPPSPVPRADAPTPPPPEPSNSSPRTGSGSGTRACPTTSPSWRAAVSSSSTSRRTRGVGTRTASFRCSPALRS